MTTKTYGLGIIGCGDFLRLQAPGILRTQGLKIAALYDPDTARVTKYAGELEARAADSAEEIIAASDVDIIGLFVPPWARKPLLVASAQAGKHVITTKPLAPSTADCEEMVRAVEQAGIVCGVIYNRTEDAKIETLKRLFREGRLGRLALFKQDWLHHYPSWNNWALDPRRNGGPFMDAMIHNLNIARYLMGRPARRGTFFSDRHAHPNLTCADTEFLKLDFEDNGAAHLFITWAADLAVYDTSGNHREHFDIWYAITDQGWRISAESKGETTVIVASRDGRSDEIPVAPLTQTPYDSLLSSIETRTAPQGILPSIQEAAMDIRIIRRTSEKPGQLVEV